MPSPAAGLERLGDLQREVFGPVLTIQTFDSEAGAVELANSTRYGLSAIVYTGSADRAERGRHRSSGRDRLDQHLPGARPRRPFGGCGLSGIGREGGDHALDFHSDLKTLILAPTPPRPSN